MSADGNGVSAFTLESTLDGAQVIRATRDLPAFPATVCGDLVRWAEHRPAAPFLAERRDGAWTTLNYGQALDRARSLGAGLLSSSVSPARPLAIVAENSVDHAVLALAAMYVGVPVAPLSVGYAAATADPGRLRDVLGVLGPGLIVAGDAAIAQRVRSAAGDVPVATGLEDLEGDPAAADAAFAGVAPDTIAKIMFTSGSTGTPKGVITTNRMLSANQTQVATTWPEITAAPTFVDWLPWSHCFGGNFVFGIVLRNGGTLYIDDGRPVPGAFAASIRNLREIAPTIFLSVPRGFTLLLEALRADDAFARRFFSRLRGLGNAAAALPNRVRDELIGLVGAYAPHPVRVTSPWGLTETAPLVTTAWGDRPPDDDTIGTVVPGIALKLAPSDGRSEIRVKGPNVTPGYWRNVQATRDAFDEDGFYRTGDAGQLKDPLDALAGIVFEGRLAENFKLATGTWVNVGALRLALIERGDPLIEDVVFTGHDTESVGALLFVRAPVAAALAGETDADHAALARHRAVRAFVAKILAEHNATSPASSTRIGRAFVIPEPPNRGLGEITDKGSVNQRRSLQLRAAAVALLTAREVHPDVVTPLAAAVGA